MIFKEKLQFFQKLKFGIHIMQYNSKEINQISFQMQNCSFELKVKILVANLTTEK